ncbi:hypothetical protein ACA910_010760 [Epithemia clementina (nom. ined.)]
MIWTQDIFDLEAEALLEAIRKSGNCETAAWEKGNDTTTTALELVNSLVREDCRSIRARFEESDDSNVLDDETLMIDDTIPVDEDMACFKTDNQNSDEDIVNLCWHFSIVYSHTFQCPILYFRVDHLNGAAETSRDMIVKSLSSQHHQNHVEDTWEFVSVEEHPIHKSPYFILHPCQTQERMKILMQATGRRDANPPGFRLLSWMSMILPAVGLAISSREFVSIQKHLSQRNSPSGASIL